MALRPVSELGLVDVTDLPSREDNEPENRRAPVPLRTSRAKATRRDPDAESPQERSRDRSARTAPSQKRREAAGRTAIKRASSTASPRFRRTAAGQGLRILKDDQPSSTSDSPVRDVRDEAPRKSKPKSLRAVAPSKDPEASGRKPQSARKSLASKQGGGSVGISKKTKSPGGATGRSARTPASGVRGTTSRRSGDGARRASRPSRSQNERDFGRLSASNTHRNGQPYGATYGSRAATLGVSVLTGAMGIAGGVLLRRTTLQNRRFLGLMV